MGPAGAVRRPIVGATAAAMLLAAPAAAQREAVANPAATLANFDLATIEPLLRETGGKFERKTGDNGAVRLVGDYDGLFINFYPVECKPDRTGCRSLEMVASYARDAFKGDDAALRALLNAYNLAHAPARAVQFDDHEPGLTRYLIGDHGFTRGNLAVEVALFGQLCDSFLADLKAGTVANSQ